MPASTSRALPKISLPKFSGDYNSWLSFRDFFTSMIIANPDIWSVEKLHYLKNHVSGETARRIANFAITSENFSQAWNVLVARYENKRVLVNAYFDQLFRLKSLTRKSAEDLKDLLATVKEVLGSLQFLGAPIEKWDYFIVYFVAKRLDPDSRKAWELQQGNNTEPAMLSDLEDFLDGRTRALEMVSSSILDKPGRSAKPSNGSRASARVNAAAASSVKCALCGESHYISRCQQFLSKTVAERRDVVTTKRLCFNCLGAHKLIECHTSKRCYLCNGHHHTLIHGSGSSSDSSSNNSAVSANTTAANTLNVTTSFASHSALAKVTHAASGSITLLATAMVRILSPQGQYISVRALLDQGSELSLVRESLVQLLQLPRRRANIPILGIGSRSTGSTRGALTLRLRSRVEPQHEFDVLAYTLPLLTGNIPSARLASSWAYISGLSLADPSFATLGKVDLVLGADVIGSLLRSSIRYGAADEPTTQATLLGWILFGPASMSPTVNQRLAPSHRALDVVPDHELSSLLHKFWCQEEVPSMKEMHITSDDKWCE